MNIDPVIERLERLLEVYKVREKEKGKDGTWIEAFRWQCWKSAIEHCILVLAQMKEE